MTVDLIFVVEMSAKHLSGLVNSMLNLDGYASAGLGFLDDLRERIRERRREKVFAILTSCALWLISSDVLHAQMSAMCR